MRKHLAPYLLWLAVAAWLALLFLVAFSVVHGNYFSPKVLLDSHPNISAEDWAALLGSPIQHIQNFLLPIWAHSRIVFPLLLLVAVGASVAWWRMRSNTAVERDGQPASLVGSLRAPRSGRPSP